jgi:hypothetical protein
MARRGIRERGVVDPSEPCVVSFLEGIRGHTTRPRQAYRRPAIVCLQRREGGGVAEEQPEGWLPSRILEDMSRHLQGRSHEGRGGRGDLGKGAGMTEAAEERVDHTVPGLGSHREVPGEGIPGGKVREEEERDLTSFGRLF